MSECLFFQKRIPRLEVRAGTLRVLLAKTDQELILAGLGVPGLRGLRGASLRRGNTNKKKTERNTLRAIPLTLSPAYARLAGQ